jgi:hypothetical protein
LIVTKGPKKVGVENKSKELKGECHGCFSFNSGFCRSSGFSIGERFCLLKGFTYR